MTNTNELVCGRSAAPDGHVMLEVHLAEEMIYAVEAELRAAEPRPAADSPQPARVAAAAWRRGSCEEWQ
jgi:hypothetical protein